MKKFIRENLTFLLITLFSGWLVVTVCQLNRELIESKEIITYLKEDIETLAIKNQELKELTDVQETEYSALYDEYLNSMYDLKVTNADLEEEILNLQTCELPVYKYSKAEIQILAKCVQAEAGEKNYEAQKMITKVILNRVQSGHFPNTIKEVIYQKDGGIPQFSVAYDGAMKKQDVKMSTLANVYSVLLFDYDMPDNVLYFYATWVKNNWVTRHTTPYKTVQGTVFAYK